MDWRLVLVVLLLAGCGVRADPPRRPEAADAVRARLGQAPCVVAALLIKAMPTDGEGELFTLRLWVTADGRTRVLGHKLDVDFLSALVAADGTYTALLPRAKVWTRGRAADADAPPPLRDLALLIAELRSGPLPAGATRAVDGGFRVRDPATGWDAEVLVDPASGLPSAKRLLAADGGERRRLDYARWQAFEGVQRPASVTLHDGDTIYAIRLKGLDTPPGVSAERMALRLPGDATEVAADEFARRISE